MALSQKKMKVTKLQQAIMCKREKVLYNLGTTDMVNEVTLHHVGLHILCEMSLSILSLSTKWL